MNTAFHRSMDQRDAAEVIASFLFGMAAGAAIMFLFDPSRGAYRRHTIRDRSLRYARDTRRSLAREAEYRMGQVRGTIAETRGAFTHEDVPDDRLAERVRAELGHHTDHAQSVQVDVQDGCVILRGSVPADEEERIVRAVEAVRSVREVDNRLSIS